MSMDQKLIDKIQKLLALATSPNENEARLAAEKANELLVRHNLSVQDLPSPDDIKTKYKNHMAYEHRVMAFEVKWVIMVIHNRFFVQVLQTPAQRHMFAKHFNSPARIHFIGTETNVAVAKYVFEFLVRKYRDLWRAYQKETGVHNHLKGEYYNGLTNGLLTQLKLKQKAVEKEMALVVRRDPHLEKAMEAYWGRTSKGSGPGVMANDADVMLDGFKEGKKLHISRGIESSGGSKGLALEDRSKK